MGLGKGHRHDLSGPPVVVTENVEDYRKAISVYLNKDDVVLELGCAQGVTTTLIGQVVREVIGVDKSTFNHAAAQNRNPNVEYHNLDAFEAGPIVRLGRKFTAIFIDISGNRPIGDVVQLIDTYHILFSPRLFVVKCYKLKRLMGMCRVFPEDFSSGELFTGHEHDRLPENGRPALQSRASHIGKDGSDGPNNSSAADDGAKSSSAAQGQSLLSHALSCCEPGED